MPESTGRKQDGTFAPGVSGNPKGRTKGSRNKFADQFLKDFMDSWELGGAEALETVRSEDPAVYIRVAASILPKELNVNEGETALERLLEQYSNDELDRLIAGLCALGDVKQAPSDKDQEGAGEQPRTIQ